MSNRVAAMVSLFLLAATGCSRSHSSGGAGGAVEQPWSHAWSGDPNGWWTSWKLEKAPFPEGTRFEFETIEMDGSRGTSAWVARSPTPGPGGIFWIEFTGDDGSQRLIAPPAAPVLRRTDPVAQREARLCDDAGCRNHESGSSRGLADARREQPVRRHRLRRSLPEFGPRDEDLDQLHHRRLSEGPVGEAQ